MWKLAEIQQPRATSDCEVLHAEQSSKGSGEDGGGEEMREEMQPAAWLHRAQAPIKV